MLLDEATVIRFWAKVNKNGPIQAHMQTPCWEWTGERKPRWHGRMRVNGAVTGVHRVSWAVHYEAPGTMWVLHKCDHPICVNPEHLFLGDVRDNTMDAKRKGRLKRGDRHWTRTTPERVHRGSQNSHARLTEDVVLDMRFERLRGDTLASIGERRGLEKGVVSSIVRGKSWRHVPLPEGPMPMVSRRKVLNSNARKVICLDTGQTFESMTAAAASVGRTQMAVANAIAKRGCCGGYRFALWSAL